MGRLVLAIHIILVVRILNAKYKILANKIKWVLTSTFEGPTWALSVAWPSEEWEDQRSGC